MQKFNESWHRCIAQYVIYIVHYDDSMFFIWGSFFGKGHTPSPWVFSMVKDAGSSFHAILLEAGVETKDQLATMLGGGEMHCG